MRRRRIVAAAAAVVMMLVAVVVVMMMMMMMMMRMMVLCHQKVQLPVSVFPSEPLALFRCRLRPDEIKRRKIQEKWCESMEKSEKRGVGMKKPASHSPMHG